jgi:hypothetical protein
MEERMTVCNMSIEAGARAGLVAPDETTYEYLAGRPFAPMGAAWEAAVARWRALPSDDGAAFDRVERLDASSLEPMITWGTSPGMGIPVRGVVPDPDGDAGLEKALRYMGLEPGRPLLGRKIDVVFIGSCTNSRLSDLREAARVLRGRRVAPGVRALVVPGSQAVKRQAEAEGLDRVFREAGAEWREAGCSMCLAMNDDRLRAGAVRGEHQQPQLRGPAGARRPHVPRQPPHRRRVGGRRGGGRRPGDAVVRPDGGGGGRGIRRSGPGWRASMKAVTRIRSRTVALPVENVDTDQIIPARFLVTTSREGLGRALFADWRREKDGSPKAGFALNRPEAAAPASSWPGATSAAAPRASTPSGRSRRRASRRWSAPPSPTSSAGTPSRTASSPSRWTRRPTRASWRRRAARSSIDVGPGSCRSAPARGFPLEPFARYCLLNGLDELAFLLSREREIAAFEAKAGPAPWRSS